MKALIFATVIFIGNASFASPKVGDYVKDMCTTTTPSETSSIVSIKEVTAYDAAKDSFEVTLTGRSGASEQVAKYWVARNHLPNRSHYQSFVQQCPADKSQRRVQIQVEVGTFDACEVATPFHYLMYFADVPFGVLKAEAKNPEAGIHTKCELQEYRFGP